MGAVCKTVASARQVRFLRLARHALVVQRMARRVPNPQAAGSTPAGSTVRTPGGAARSWRLSVFAGGLGAELRGCLRRGRAARGLTGDPGGRAGGGPAGPRG